MDAHALLHFRTLDMHLISEAWSSPLPSSTASLTFLFDWYDSIAKERAAAGSETIDSTREKLRWTL